MGLPRLGGAYAWRSMLDSGARLAFGSDFPVESPNPFHGLAAGMSREDAQGRPPGGWLPAQRLTLEEALAAFTTGAAYAGFAEDRIGSLQPGRHAGISAPGAADAATGAAKATAAVANKPSTVDALLAIYERARPRYHAVSVRTLDEMLAWQQK